MNKKYYPEPEPIPLTPEAITRLEARLRRLKHELPAAAAEAARTAAYGDRSENAEYKEAKSLLRRMNRQIWTIEDQLKRVVPITTGPDPSGKVTLGSLVRLRDGEGKEENFRILGPHESDPGRGVISHRSPLGAALLGRGAGETIVLHAPAGERRYTIVTVR